MPKSTLIAGERFCPKCNRWGQRKYYKNKRCKSIYERFDHYGQFLGDGEIKITKRHTHYLYCCYIGKVISDDEKKMEIINNRFENFLAQTRKTNIDIITTEKPIITPLPTPIRLKDL